MQVSEEQDETVVSGLLLQISDGEQRQSEAALNEQRDIGERAGEPAEKLAKPKE